LSRERALIGYCLGVAALGWAWLLTSGPTVAPTVAVLFCALALLVELFGFRIPPADPHSLAGIVLLAAALALGSANGALIAAISGLIFGVLQPLIYNRPRSFLLLVARPLFRSGVRASAVLASTGLAGLLGLSGPIALLAIIPVYAVTIQSARALRELLQGGITGMRTWWYSSWRPMALAEIAPLPLAALFAAIYATLGVGYFMLSAAGLLATSIAVRRAVQNLRRQRRSVQELALLNEASRAIIRAELDADALCDLIYREASKVVDTSSFHLGLFEPDSDRYTLMVRVQDRVRLPQLTVNLPVGDGIVGWMRQTGRALLVEDFETEMDLLPARPRYQSDRPPRSGIYVPLINGETVIGSLSIQSYRPNVFDTDDMRFLSLIADQAAVAIAKARAYEDARQRAVQLQAIHEVSERITAILNLDELLPSVVRLIREHFGYHPVHIFTLEDPGQLIFRASTAEGPAAAALGAQPMQLGQGLVGSAVQAGEPLIVDDVHTDPRYIGDDTQTRSEMVVPLRFGDWIIGVLDVQSAEACRFSQRDLSVMQTLADQIAVAIESARAYEAQTQEAWTLNALLQVAENIARTSSLDELLQTIVRLPPLLLGCDRCYCIFWDREQALFTPRAAYGLTEHQRAAFIGWGFAADRAPLLADVVRSVAPTAVADAGARPEICPPILEPFGGQTLLALPLWTRGATHGVLVVDYQVARPSFSPREMTLYTGISNQIAAALESALLAQEAASAARLEEELHVARGVQTALLPKSVPDMPGWDASADWRSARTVGGDFYDYWWISPTGGLAPTDDTSAAQLGFVIADVSDKGVPAAMFMALSRSLVRAAALDGSPPAQALVRANRWIARDSDSAMFVTIFYGMLDLPSGRLTYCCAGHNPPILIRAGGSVQELTTPGIALGVLEEIQLSQAEVTLDAGDLLICYTDGVTEAFDSHGEQFGVPRLIEVARQHQRETAAAIVQAINLALHQFADGVIYDDVTLLVIRRVPPPA
jgi:serine phosphatase RsbU (regulator of sigma subunit)/putative methionine-R-sulfoxide reductase with GAF domain